MEAGVFGLLGALIGASASIATAFLSNKHAINMQSSANSLNRHEMARAFQRDNMLACQEQMQVVGRLTTKAFHEDVMALQSGTPWKTHSLPQQLDEDLGENRRKLSVLIERVANDELRNELKLLSRLLLDVTAALSFHEAEHALGNAMAGNQKTMELLGTVLRQTY